MRWMFAVMLVVVAALLTQSVVAGSFDSINPPDSVPSLVPVASKAPSTSKPSTNTPSSTTTPTSTAPVTPPSSYTGGGSLNPITSPYQPIDEPIEEESEEDVYSEYEEEVEEEEPSSTGFFSTTTILVLMLVPILIGTGAWYVLSHKKSKDKPLSYPEEHLPPLSNGMYPPLQMEPPAAMQMPPSQSTPPPTKIQFDASTLRKAKQYVAGLRSENIPDHKIARAMREADWPAAYIEEAMKKD